MTTRSAPGADDIFMAARDLFAEHGFDAVSVSAIAQRAGSSKANIFHHFGSKEGLYNAIIRSTVDRMTDAFRQAVASGSAPSTQVENAIRGSLDVLLQDPPRADLVFREVVEADALRGRELAQSLFAEQFATLTRLFEQAQDSGECESALDASFLAFLLLASNLMLFHCRHVLSHLPASGLIADQEHYVALLRGVLVGNRGAAAGDLP